MGEGGGATAIKVANRAEVVTLHESRASAIRDRPSPIAHPRLSRLRIDPLEVLQNCATLNSRQPTQRVPRWFAESVRRTTARVGVVRLELIAGLRRLRLTLARIFTFFL